MGKSPSQFEETIQHQFDRLCKLALKGEKIDYIRHMEYLRKNEVMLSELSQKELDQLAIYDEYVSLVVLHISQYEEDKSTVKFISCNILVI